MYTREASRKKDCCSGCRARFDPAGERRAREPLCGATRSPVTSSVDAGRGYDQATNLELHGALAGRSRLTRCHLSHHGVHELLGVALEVLTRLPDLDDLEATTRGTTDVDEETFHFAFRTSTELGMRSVIDLDRRRDRTDHSVHVRPLARLTPRDRSR